MDRKWPESARWTENDVSDRGYRNREQIDFSTARVLNYITDPDRKLRIERLNCILCFYRGAQLAGQAMTNWNCRACLKDQSLWSNTSPPLLCKECAKKFKLCTDCGADVYLRVRRSNTLTLKERDA